MCLCYKKTQAKAWIKYQSHVRVVASTWIQSDINDKTIKHFIAQATERKPSWNTASVWKHALLLIVCAERNKATCTQTVRRLKCCYYIHRIKSHERSAHKFIFPPAGVVHWIARVIEKSACSYRRVQKNLNHGLVAQHLKKIKLHYNLKI